MMLYAVIFILVLVFLVLLKVKVIMEYVFKKGINHFIISISLIGGLIKYSYKIPAAKEKKIILKKKKPLILKTGLDFQSYIDMFNFIKGRILIEKFDLNINAGSEDAAIAAVITGGLWSIAGVIISFFENSMRVIEKNVHITPCYGKNVFNIDLFCIISIRIVNIILIGLYFILKLIKGKIKSRRWYKWHIPLKG